MLPSDGRATMDAAFEEGERMATHGRTQGETRMFGILVGMIVLTLAAYVGFVLAFVDPVPGELWVGFAVVVGVGVVLAGVAALLVFRSDRPSIGQGYAHHEGTPAIRRILVVTDESIGSEALRQEVCSRAGGCESEVLVVAPALNTPIRHWTDDDSGAEARAHARLGEELAVLTELGVRARGAVGSDDPLQAIDDALRTFDADQIIIATADTDRLNWLESGVVEQVRETYHLPVTHLVAA